MRVAAEMATSGEAFEYGSDDEVVDVEKVVAQFVDADGEETGPQVLLPLDVTPHQLEVLINEMVNNVCGPEHKRWMKSVCTKSVCTKSVCTKSVWSEHVEQRA